MKKYFIILLAVLIMFQNGYAQEGTIDDFLNLKLPPLELLFENSKKSSMTEFYDNKMEIQELALKTQRRSWLSYFSLFGTYQYGVMGMSSYTDGGINIPIVYQTSGGQQLWYNVGASIRIPLDNIFDRRNRIKTQQLKIKETLKERDMWYDQQKIKIIELYNKSSVILSRLNLLVEQSIISKSQYENSQKEYIMGNITIRDLNSANGAYINSTIAVMNEKYELNTILLQLEIISSTKILKR